ncbi:uncharacterized protein EV420DRAFT_1515400, partial [Desarmillaria tabescens]
QHAHVVNFFVFIGCLHGTNCIQTNNRPRWSCPHIGTLRLTAYYLSTVLPGALVIASCLFIRDLQASAMPAPILFYLCVLNYTESIITGKFRNRRN